ncbi:hypothetical protein [Natronomonas sp.]|uniref:hypothetical protein n=1 Tax=Natronomonas sp. TaxID=2184060 RepID=UPI002FC30AA2
MPPTIAVAHYPEGAGHATRMLAIANAIENGGGSVRMAGSGAGTEFIALNGYDEYDPTNFFNHNQNIAPSATAQTDGGAGTDE